MRETTPVSFPERRAPAMAEAGTVGVDTGDGGAPPPADDPEASDWGPINGVAGAEGDGEADSTTHMR